MGRFSEAKRKGPCKGCPVVIEPGDEIYNDDCGSNFHAACWDKLKDRDPEIVAHYKGKMAARAAAELTAGDVPAPGQTPRETVAEAGGPCGGCDVAVRRGDRIRRVGSLTFHSACFFRTRIKPAAPRRDGEFVTQVARWDMKCDECDGRIEIMDEVVWNGLRKDKAKHWHPSCFEEKHGVVPRST